MSEATQDLAKLVRKYDVAGPRYTSYPTVPVWSETVGWAEAHAALARAGQEESPLALYVHLPFCGERCLFCGCTTVITRVTRLIDEYIRYLDQEMALVAGSLGRRRQLAQLHFGGGTPTHLSLSQLDKVLRAVASHFDIRPDVEFAVEVDPAVCSDEQLDLLGQWGMNRISLGVQDVDPEVQAAVRRVQTFEDTERVTRRARALGIESVNFDLIYGLPHQTPDRFATSLARVLELEPTRLALYSFAYVPWLKPHQRALPEDALPSADVKFAIFDRARRDLADAGYEHIGMDHFARADDELARAQRDGALKRNFMGYTVAAGEDLIAVGMSGISRVGDTFYQSFADLKQYFARLKAGEGPVHRGYRLSRDDQIRETVIQELMCNLTLDLDAISSRFGVDAAEYLAESVSRLDPLVADGLVRVRDHRIEVDPRGKLFLRNIAMCFDEYLGERKPAQARFSRTV